MVESRPNISPCTGQLKGLPARFPAAPTTMQETADASENLPEVLVVAATEREIRPLRDRLQSPGAAGAEAGDDTLRGAIGP